MSIPDPARLIFDAGASAAVGFNFVFHAAETNVSSCCGVDKQLISPKRETHKIACRPRLAPAEDIVQP